MSKIQNIFIETAIRRLQINKKLRFNISVFFQIAFEISKLTACPSKSFQYLQINPEIIIINAQEIYKSVVFTAKIFQNKNDKISTFKPERKLSKNIPAAILICETNSIIESDVIFLDFSKKKMEIHAIIARRIHEIILSTENIRPRIIHRKLAFAMVCPI